MLIHYPANNNEPEEPENKSVSNDHKTISEKLKNFDNNYFNPNSSYEKALTESQELRSPEKKDDLSKYERLFEQSIEKAKSKEALEQFSFHFDMKQITVKMTRGYASGFLIPGNISSVIILRSAYDISSFQDVSASVWNQQMQEIDIPSESIFKI